MADNTRRSKPRSRCSGREPNPPVAFLGRGGRWGCLHMLRKGRNWYRRRGRRGLGGGGGGSQRPGSRLLRRRWRGRRPIPSRLFGHSGGTTSRASGACSDGDSRRLDRQRHGAGPSAPGRVGSASGSSPGSANRRSDPSATGSRRRLAGWSRSRGVRASRSRRRTGRILGTDAGGVSTARGPRRLAGFTRNSPESDTGGIGR